MNIEDTISNHPASDLHHIGTPGFSFPKLLKPCAVDIDAAGVQRLKPFGIHVVGGHGAGNRVILDEAAFKPQNFTLDFGRRKNNTVILDACHSLSGKIHFAGDANLAVICRGWYTLHIDFVGNESAFYVSKASSIGKANCWVQGDRRSIIIGEDCMFAWGIGLRTGDAHSIIDIERRVQTNLPKNVLIGAHVWLAPDVLVFKGVEIGKGTVVGARSTVSRGLPAKCLANGSPARAVRQNISWCRPASPSQDEIEQILTRPYLLQEDMP